MMAPLYCFGVAVPEISTGLSGEPNIGINARIRSESSGEISLSSLIGIPQRSKWSHDRSPEPPPLVIITTLSSLRGGWSPSASEVSRYSCQVVARITPALSNISS